METNPINTSEKIENTSIVETGGFENLNQRLWTEMTEEELLELLQGSVCMYGRKGGVPD